MLRPLATVLVASALLSGLASAPAGAAESVAAEEREGGAVMRAVEAGGRECNELSERDFERVGEYVMGRMAGSTAAHEAMNARMAAMMGERAEEQMHAVLGRRFTRCGGRQAPPGFGGMMAMMAGGSFGGGMMGGPGMDPASERGAPPTWPHRYGRGDGGSGGWATAGMLVLVTLLVALVAVGLGRRRPRVGPSAGPGGDALEILAHRYARGDLDTDDYQRRRNALGGTR